MWRFYRRHRQNMRELFRRTVRTAVPGGGGDGTKVKNEGGEEGVVARSWQIRKRCGSVSNE